MNILSILLILLAFSAFVTLVTFPCWRHHAKGWKQLITNTTPYLAWATITGLGYGAQSLSNLIEFLFIICFQILITFIFWILRYKHHKEFPIWMTTVLSIIFAILLRIFMPIIPE